MKTVYICGDSFGCSDIEYAVTPWVELLCHQLPGWTVQNLSRVCASNLHIRLQVDKAIANQANFVIMLATTCTRGHGKINNKQKSTDSLIDRFLQIGNQNHNNSNKDLACYSMNSLDSTCVLDDRQIEIIKDYRDHVFDLELEIYQNKCIIESTLYALEKSQIPFVFDQGGFENIKFGVSSDKKYFTEFDHRRSKINLWSEFTNTMQHRPYFHITDPGIHQLTAQYYASMIQTTII